MLMNFFAAVESEIIEVIKSGAETGVAPAATVIGIAVVSAIGVFFSVKKKD